jgi:hypothetical protein
VRNAPCFSGTGVFVKVSCCFGDSTPIAGVEADNKLSHSQEPLVEEHVPNVLAAWGTVAAIVDMLCHESL